MSTTSPSTTSLPQAPWKSLFSEHLSKMPTPHFVLSTLSPNISPFTPHPYSPRARYVIYRGFWAELPANKHNTAPQNPRVYESEMPCITTDVRMQKVGELFASREWAADDVEHIQGTGGGGPVEAVWWAEEASTQWRIKGLAYVLNREDIEGEGEERNGARMVRSEVGERMRVVEGQEGKEGEWSWAREVLGHFGNNSPGIRGSFKAPPPGQSVTEPYDSENLVLGSKVDNLEDHTALKHFRVVVIRPDEVEQTDLSDPENSRRYVYTISHDGSWSTKETWP